MKRSWIKLWIEVLHDPKMVRLPDWEWRRAVELFMLAGMNGDDGTLPTVPDMAIVLRTSEAKLAHDLTALSKIGVVSKARGGWVVTKFKERQYSESTERMRVLREKQRHSDAHSDAHSASSSSSSSEFLEEGMQGEKPSETPRPPLSPEQVQEVIVEANRAVDFTLENFAKVRYANRNHIPEIHLWRCDLYVELTGQHPHKAEVAQWAQEFDDWQQEGFQPEHIRAAFEAAMNGDKGWNVSHPGALTKAARSAKTRMGYVAGKQGALSEYDRAMSVVRGANG